MIVVKIELHSAITKTVKEIGRMYICNSGGDRARGDYKAYVCRRGNPRPTVEMAKDDGIEVESGSVRATRLGSTESFELGPVEDSLSVGRVFKYPRNAYSVWRLVMRCLGSAFPEEKSGHVG